MNKKILVMVALFAMLVVSACNEKKSPVLNETVNSKNITQVSEKITSDAVISNEELNLFVGGLNRLITTDAEYEGKSVGEIIELQKTFLRENLNKQVDDAMLRIAISANHEFKFDGMIPYDTLDISRNYFRYTVTNPTDKEMTNVEGALTFYNVQGTLVKNYPLKSSLLMKEGETIKPGESRTFNMPFENDPKSPRDQTMRNQFKNLRSVWRAVTVEFSDGTKLTTTPPEKEKNAE